MAAKTKVKNLKLGDQVYLTDAVDELVGAASSAAASKIASVTGSSGVAATTDASKNVTVTAKVSAKSGNVLTVQTGAGEEGLYVPSPAAVTSGNAAIDVSNNAVSLVVSGATGNGLVIKGSTEASPGLFVDAASLGLSTAYVPKGSMTVAGANEDDSTSSPAPESKWKIGWVYNMADDGTINNGLIRSGTSGAQDTGGPITVKAGDNIVRIKGSDNKLHWDKLSATIDVPVTNVSSESPVTVTSSSGDFKVGLAYGNGLTVPTDSSDPNEDKLVVLADPSGGLKVGSSGVAVKLPTNSGLSMSSSGLAVAAKGSIEVDSAGVGVRLDPNSGMTVGSDGLAVGGGNGITVAGSSVSVNATGVLAADSTGVYLNIGLGLQPVSGCNSSNLAVQPGTAISVDGSGVSVNYGNGLTASSGQLVVNYGNGLTLDGSQLIVDAYNGIEVSNNGVGVKGSTVSDHKSISAENSGVYVDLNRALQGAVTGNTGSSVSDDTTIYHLVKSLGGTISNS